MNRLRSSFLLLLGLAAGCQSSGLFPVVIVPGIIGSQLDGIHDTPQPYPFYCQRLKNWTNVWVSLEDIVPYRLQNCLTPDLSFKYDNTSETYRSPPGVRIRPHDFGSTDGIEYLDPNPVFKHMSKYFGPFVDYLVDTLGYQRGRTVFGAPYDWRLSPWRQDFDVLLKKLIEKASSMNNNRPVIVVSHSMGGPFCQDFFSHQTQEWKDRFVKLYFSLEGAFLGAPKVVMALVSGDNFHLPMRSHNLVQLERTLESPLFLLPNKHKWPKDQNTLLFTLRRNYTINDYVSLLRDLNVTDGAQKLNFLEKRWANVSAPGVTTHCVYGRGMQTPAAYAYDDPAKATEPDKIIYTDGDGTVPLHSLLGCELWKEQQKAPIFLKPLDGAEHVEAIRDTRVFEYFKEVVSSL